MNYLAAVAVLAAGVNAFAIRGDTCCFEVTASGGTSGSVGQLSDGQNRIGGGLPPATFCINSSGVITDNNGRACILTPPTSQLQCDTGATGTPGFSVSSSGELEFNGNINFKACQTGDNGSFNIYSNPPSGDVTGCVDVTLTANGCQAPSSSSAPPSPPATSVTVVTVTETVCAISESSIAQPTLHSTSSSPGPPHGGTSSAPSPPTETASSSSAPSSSKPSSSPTSSGTACPTTLSSGGFEFPHLIVPINSASPNTATGSQLNGEISTTVSSIFNFDIPGSDSGKSCSLIFLLPEQSQLQTSSFTFSGDGKVDISELSSPATESTTFNNAPSVEHDFGEITIAPGNSYHIASFTCPAGERIGFEIENAGSTNLTFFQDFNPSPIGLYITTC
ncbi:ubiquitin 3 binding protein But2 C-terminal domain-containing protein [Talaromyces proteolyticus]|uniref:Ubiquitin 3 binding protein But2 C-terminal domain-containing protein n=1 Tax=Talaromyces proteolyticus TaxID=1131652 RepID=A0AAD4KFB2_9EURO|nr:ubiquitin 3 binding protein But2 C-terminal domain-containing protein [Talaromyces proteolyticus]KAH8690284.1 ubiquitin 3 binding protein But2 C-terminal domain-containing protein [Talaromyces proteolyticus]